MEMLTILEALEDTIERGVPVPFSGKCVVDKDELLELIKEIRLKLPDDIKQAKWVKEERQRILHDAQKEAGNIVKNAESKIASLVDEHEIAKRAYEQSNQIIAAAQKSAKEIRSGAKEYADSLLGKVEEILKDTLDVLSTNREELK